MDRHEPNGNLHPTGSNPTASLGVSNAHAEPLQPPSRLTAEEAEVWHETVQSVRADWFRGSETVLETFVRAVVVERRLASLLRESDPLVDEDFAASVKLHHGAAMLVGNLAGKLRLTVRSTRERDTSKLPRAAWKDVSNPLPS